jgi:hypothetical protein
MMNGELERIETEAKVAKVLSRHMPKVTEESHEKPQESQQQIREFDPDQKYSQLDSNVRVTRRECLWKQQQFHITA